MTLTPTEAKDQLTGAWKLLSFDLVLGDGSGSQKTVQPAGPTPLGRLLFTSDGFMTGTVTDPELVKRVNPAKPWAASPDEDVAYVARRAVSYSGHFKVFAEDGGLKISTQVHVSTDISLIGTEQARRLELKEESGQRILTLRPVNPMPTPVCQHDTFATLIGN
jgi:hypothetical protein